MWGKGWKTPNGFDCNEVNANLYHHIQESGEDKTQTLRIETETDVRTYLLENTFLYHLRHNPNKR